MIRTISICLCIILFGLLFSCTKIRVVWLDELDMNQADQAAGVTRVNQSMWRTPLVIASDTFARGVGTHAAGIIRIELDGKTRSFEAAVGIDDSAPEHELKQASAEFVITGDDRILWRSGIMHAGDKAKPVKVSLQGIRSLILAVNHAGDGTVGDRVDWVNARFETSGNNPYTVKRTHETEYLQTPAEPLYPLINPPYYYGIRPGRPALFTIPVSGERPMEIKIGNLPPGLSFDAAQGIISGKIKEKGTYVMDVTASNRHGSDTHRLTFEAGESIALTPPMGWSSWNVFGADIDEAKIRAIADALVEKGLIHYGYTYINIDDGWQGKRGGKYNAIQANEKFPDMKALVDYIHAQGLKAGIYSSPWVQTFAGYTGGSADAPGGSVADPSRRTGKYSFAAQDVKQWVEWGFDYLKYDWVVNDLPNTSEMAECLRQSGRDIVFSISNAAPFEQAADWSLLTNARRTTGDIVDSWCNMTSIGFLQDKWSPYASPGSWNDPDMLVVGKLGWGDVLRPTRLSPDEQYLHISLWSLLAAPLIMGCDLTTLDDFTLNLLKNREVVAVNQDIAGIQGRRIYHDDAKGIEIWSKPLSDGSLAAGLFNLSEKEQMLSIEWSQLNIQGTHTVRNLWKQEDAGRYDSVFSAKTPAHGVTFVKIYH
ncbi:MAG: NPCBM/NEW2 domain-containing protein [Dysgonamonadaceae bacterium]|jgi:alpha-galactosidase|nr:NPCBM/NEW2 domain-containing protein [Dysgonamonadaceae bacterium]